MASSNNSVSVQPLVFLAIVATGGGSEMVEAAGENRLVDVDSGGADLAGQNVKSSGASRKICS